MIEDFKKIKEKNKKLKNKKLERKTERFLKKIYSNKIESKNISKKGQPTLTIQNKEVPSVLNDPNRFFTGELNKEKRSLYFS
jgi:hypothetical protein